MALNSGAIALCFTFQYVMFIEGEKACKPHFTLPTQRWQSQSSVQVTSGTLNGLCEGLAGVRTPLKVFGLFFKALSVTVELSEGREKGEAEVNKGWLGGITASTLKPFKQD